jgi:DegV family protein with EDD domain
MYVSLETLEYLKKGGRISGAQAAIGNLLSVKPIIAVADGVVDTPDRPRTRAKSRERCIELICQRPIERLAILHTMAPDVEEFKAEVIRRSGIDRANVQTSIVGASVGPHLGPGCVGAAVLYRR